MVADAGPGQRAVHASFLAFRVDPSFRRLDPVTKGSALTEFRQFLRHPVGPIELRPHLALGGRHRFDFLFWSTGGGPKSGGEVLAALHKTQFGRHLEVVLDAVGAGEHAPSELPVLSFTTAPHGRPPDWGTIAAALSKHPGLRLAEYDGLAGEGRLLAFQGSDVLDFPAFARDIAGLGPAWVATRESPDALIAALSL